MANMVLVSVFDHAVGEYAPCMCVNSEAAAVRIFTLLSLLPYNLCFMLSYSEK